MLSLDLAREIMGYMKTRTEARELYRVTIHRLERMRGSQYYDDEAKAAREKRAATVEEAQAKARAACQQIFSKMRENAAKIHTSPPTPEQLAILQALQMREGVTPEELEEIAAAMEGNALALSVVDEISRKNGRYSNFGGTMSRKLSRAAAESMIHELQRGAEKIIDDPVGVAPAAALYAHSQSMLYNRNIDLDDLPQAPEYSDEFELLEALGVTDFDAFTSAVG